MLGTCLCSKPGISLKVLGRNRASTIYYKSIRFESRYTTSAVKSRDLPWIQHSRDEFKKEPVLHRLLGHILFRSVLKKGKIPLVNWPQFQYGAAEAIKRIAKCINVQDSDDELQYFLGPALLFQYKTAFEQLQFENKKLQLYVEDPRRMHISGARMIIGEVEPGDEYVLGLLGQKIIISKNEYEEFVVENGDGGVMEAFKSGKSYGEAAFHKGIRFQLDVKFELFERFAVWDCSDTNNADIEITPTNVYHRWRFETAIRLFDEEEIQLDWNVVDIDDFLKKKFLLPEESKNQY